MTAPPWGHKPPPVDDEMRYWIDPPPEPSARCEYWQRRYREGSWKPNKWCARDGYHTGANRFGVYIWEWWNILRPMIHDHYAAQESARG